MICLKICTFVVSKTTKVTERLTTSPLWFAWKSVPLWYLKQLKYFFHSTFRVVICLKICTFVVSKTTNLVSIQDRTGLWFAWKSVPLWYLKQLLNILGNRGSVVICLKICTFVVSKTTWSIWHSNCSLLWFAWKSVPLWYLKQQKLLRSLFHFGCDLLENLYLCGI